MAAIYTFENVSAEKLEAGLAELCKSGLSADNGAVKGMGVEATYALAASTLTVTVEKHPPFMASMIESQLRKFFG